MSPSTAVLLIAWVSAAPLSPEEFLRTLADSSSGYDGAAFWIESASDRASLEGIGTDSLASILEGMSGISVVPGPPSLVEVDEAAGSYVVEYPDAEWSWIDGRGRVIRAFGGTSVEMSGGRYGWIDLPVFEGGVYVSMRHRLLAGFLGTVAVLVLAVFVLWWVRRKYTGR